MQDWFAYQDDDGYWIESAGSAPSIVIAAPSQERYCDIISALRQPDGDSEGDSVVSLRPLHIKDPVHRYIYAPPPVKYSLRSKFVQRLRHLRQNGLAFMVFPSLQSTRFEHSLGAMWLAWRICDEIFKNTEPRLIRDFASKIIDDFAQLGVADVLVATSGHGPPVEDHGNALERVAGRVNAGVCASGFHLGNLGQVPGKTRKELANRAIARHFLKLTACYYALLHDIGHLPFSHTLEEPLEDLITDSWFWTFAAPFLKEQSGLPTKLHELISLVVIQKFDAFTSEGWKRAVLLSFLASTKLNTKWKDGEDPRSRVFSVIHDLVSGDVDIDRLDFVARDGYMSGASFGHYDLDRLVRAALVHRDATNGNTFRIIFDGHAVREIESLLLERAKMYNVMAFHHKVRFFDAALGACFKAAELGWELPRGNAEGRDVADGLDVKTPVKNALFSTCLCEGGEVLSKDDVLSTCFLRLATEKKGDYRHINTEFLKGKDLEGSQFFDDSWVLNLIRLAPMPDGENQRRDLALRGAILYRQDIAYSLYKRPDDFLDIRDKLFDQVSRHINSIEQNGSSERLSPGDVQRVLIGLREDRKGRKAMRRMIEHFPSAFNQAKGEVAPQLHIPEDMPDYDKGRLQEFQSELGNCFALVSETRESFARRFDDLKVQLPAGRHLPATGLSGILSGVAGIPNEIGYFVYIVWTGEEGQSPWSDAGDPVAKAWRRKKDILEGIFYRSLSLTMSWYLKEAGAEALKLFDRLKQRRRG